MSKDVWGKLNDLVSLTKKDDDPECIVALKYFKDIGWVGVKNRDRNYKPTVRIRQSFKGGIERLYLWDDKTRYTEGLNEHGVSILSSAIAVKTDEKEGKGKKRKDFYSPDGKKIRTALLEKTVENAIDVLVDKKISGHTAIFDKDRAFILESSHNEDNEYKYETVEVSKSKNAVRTNHGILLPWAGYQPDGNDWEQKARESSEVRLEKVLKSIKGIDDPHRMLDCISDTKDKNPQLNPLRLDDPESDALKTTGQLMIIPSELTLYYRPIWCDVEFDFDKINSPSTNIYFQILSSREIMKRFE